MELNAEQIIKALKCFDSTKTGDTTCVGCYFETKGICVQNCTAELADAALALIKELTEVVEQGETARGRKESIDNGFSPSVTELQRENERLNQIIAQLGKNNDEIARVYPLAIKEAKADTVRKMQERLKEHLEKPEFPWDSFTVAEEVIDQIAKEMLEGDQ